MHAIRSVMRLDNLKDLTYWALWTSQWQGGMRSSDILRPNDDKSRRWDPARDMHVGRITYEDVNTDENGGCRTRMRWRLKLNKTDQGGENRFEKTFPVDGNRSDISAGFEIYRPSHKRGYRDVWDHHNTQLFMDPDTGKEITIASSRKLLAMKLREAGISPKHIKSHSLRIKGREGTAYAKSPEGCSITAGFLGLWSLGARWSYMNAYRRPIELAGLEVAREAGGN